MLEFWRGRPVPFPGSGRLPAPELPMLSPRKTGRIPALGRMVFFLSKEGFFTLARGIL
jgi:hypothetical protein